jgi:hypothetical protein
MSMYLPFGVLLWVEGRSRGQTTERTAITAGAVSLLLSIGIEYLQAFLPSRDSSAIDVIANTTGALAGVFAGRTWAEGGARSLEGLRARISPAWLVGLLAAWLIVALSATAILQARTGLSSWCPDYPLLIGNEDTGDRSWRGRVYSLAMTDAATPPDTVRRFAAGERLILAGAQMGVFDFRGQAPYQDATGVLPNLGWTESPNRSNGNGITFPGPGWMRSESPAGALVHRLRQSNAFTLRIDCATDDTNQEGPARVVSSSVSPYLRNFTLGQQGSDLVFRLRTPATGTNGHPLEVHVPGMFSDRNRHEILVTYDGATLAIAQARSVRLSRTELSPGASAALAIPSLSVQPDQLPIYKIAFVVLLFSLPALLIGFFARTRRERQEFGVSWAIACAVLFEATIARTSGRAFDWSNVVVTASVGGSVLMLGGLVLSQPDERRKASIGNLDGHLPGAGFDPDTSVADHRAT